MNVLIGLDMEGISGIADIEQMFRWHGEYHVTGRRLITEDLNAVVRGFRRGGVERIRVVDYHFGGENLIAEGMEPDVEVRNGLRAFGQSLEEGKWDALALVGEHAMGGTPDGFLSHSFVPYLRTRVNGVPTGEVGVLSALAATYGVPTLLVTGDAAVVREAKSVLPNAVHVSVKQGKGRGNTDLLPAEEACRRLEEGAEAAVQSRMASLHPASCPVKVEMRFPGPDIPEVMSGLPGVTLADPVTVSFESPDYAGAVRVLHAGIRLYEGDLMDSLLSRIGASEGGSAHVTAAGAAFEGEWLREPAGVW